MWQQVRGACLFLLAAAVLIGGGPLGAQEASRPLAVIQQIEGAGVVEVCTGPEELVQHDAWGILNVGTLAEHGVLPERFQALRKSFAESETDIDGWTIAILTINLGVGESMLDLAESAAAWIFDAAASPDATDEAREFAAQTRRQLDQGRKNFAESKELLAFMEGRSYLTWAPASVGDPLGKDQFLRTAVGSEGEIHLEGGAFFRLKESTVVVVREVQMEGTGTKMVRVQLLNGSGTFHSPEGDGHPGMSTPRVEMNSAGATFTATHHLGQTTIEVAEGTVEIVGAGDEMIRLEAGQSRLFGGDDEEEAEGGDEGDEESEAEPLPMIEEAVPPREDDAGWGRHKAGNVSLMIPVFWERRRDSPEGEVAWGIFPSDPKPQVLLRVMRVSTPEALRERFEITAEMPITIAGRAATCCTGRPLASGAEAKALLMILDDQEVDGGYISIVGTTKDGSEAVDRTFRRVIASVRIDGEGGVEGLPASALEPAAPPIPNPLGAEEPTVPEKTQPTEPPTEPDEPTEPTEPGPIGEPPAPPGPAEPGWAWRSAGNVTVQVPEAWISEGDAPPGSAAWRLGESMSNPDAVFAVIRVPSFEEFRGGLTIEEEIAITISGCAAKRITGTPDGEEGRAIVVLLDRVESDGLKLGFIAFSVGEHWATYLETYDRIFASVLIGK